MTRSRLLVLVLIFLTASIAIFRNDILRALPPSSEARDFITKLEARLSEGDTEILASALASFEWDEVCLSRSAVGLKHELFGSKRTVKTAAAVERYAVALAFFTDDETVAVLGFPRNQKVVVDNASFDFAGFNSDSGGSKCADRNSAKFSKTQARGREAITLTE